MATLQIGQCLAFRQLCRRRLPIPRTARVGISLTALFAAALTAAARTEQRAVSTPAKTALVLFGRMTQWPSIDAGSAPPASGGSGSAGYARQRTEAQVESAYFRTASPGRLDRSR